MAQDLLFPTASTVAVFLNGLHVDLAYRLDFRDNQPKTPIYGYNDYEFTKVVKGRNIVQGMLIVAFTVPFYLNNAIKARQDSFVPRLYNYQVGSSISTDNQYKDKLKQSFATELPPNIGTAEKAARAEYIASLLSKKKSSVKDKIKQSLYEFFNTETIAEDARGTSTNIYPSPLTEESESQYGSTLDVYYYDPDYVTWFTRFSNVHFYDITQQASQAGSEGSSEPLYEIYSFIAKNRVTKLIE